MKVNAKNVQQLARQSEEENWDFRSWLKFQGDLSPRQIDRLAAEATREVWSSFDCTTCANCCKDLDTEVTGEEIRQMAGALGISEREFHQRHISGKVAPEDLDPEESPDRWLMPGDPCPMLKDNKCSIYDARPQQCRKYPYLQEPNFSGRSMGIIDRTFTCPIAYQVMEKLKSMLPQWRQASGLDWNEPLIHEDSESLEPGSEDLGRVLEDADAAIRANEHMETLREKLGQQAFLFDSDLESPETREAFREDVEEIEGEEWSSTRSWLIEDGVELPSPEELDDQQLTAKLWEVIHALADRRTFLYHTDHLSDRELYEQLWHEILDDAMPNMGFSPDGQYIIDMIGACSEEDLEINLRYYADDRQREDWARQWPEDTIPPRETPPYRRDEHLPRSDLD